MSDNHHDSTYRILDAAANRAGEGFRCLEEFARFVLDDVSLSGELKELRHGLTSALEHFPRPYRLRARDTPGDVGTELTTAAESVRLNTADVIASAASRTQQSLRVLEEYGKLIDADAASAIEQIRYRCYTVCAQLELAMPGKQRRDRLLAAKLYVLIDSGPDEESFGALCQSLCENGVDILQLRDRQADDRTLIARARIATEIARTAGALLIVNDRVDLAVASGADGVHVGQEELPAPVARQIIGPDRLVGVSTHSLDQAQQAVREGADYIGCGPVFAGTTKSFEAYVGPALLTEVSEAIKIPAFAIGGIDHHNLAEVIGAGFRRIAVTGAVGNSPDPAAAAAKLKQMLSTTE